MSLGTADSGGILHIIVQIIEPVSITQNSSIYGCECFGLGIFMVYNPPCANLNNVENRAYIYYQGVLSISTATVECSDGSNSEDDDYGNINLTLGELIACITVATVGTLIVYLTFLWFLA